MTRSTPAPAPASAQRPMRADARRNYERLVATATAAFAERGAEASLDDIARRAGVGSGTLYRHFPTRQALLEAVYRDQVEELCSQARELLASPSPGDAFATWLRAMASYMTTKRGLSSLMTPTPSCFPRAARLCAGTGERCSTAPSGREACARTPTWTTCSSSCTRSLWRPSTRPTAPIRPAGSSES